MILYTTNDIGIAAFLIVKGLQMQKCDISNGKYIFEFFDPDNKAPEFSIEYINSECSKFDHQVKNLRKILNSLKRT